MPPRRHESFHPCAGDWFRAFRNERFPVLSSCEPGSAINTNFISLHRMNRQQNQQPSSLLVKLLRTRSDDRSYSKNRNRCIPRPFTNDQKNGFCPRENLVDQMTLVLSNYCDITSGFTTDYSAFVSFFWVLAISFLISESKSELWDPWQLRIRPDGEFATLFLFSKRS